MSKWRIEALIIKNEKREFLYDSQRRIYRISQQKYEIQGFTNEDEVPIIAGFQIRTQIVDYKTIGNSILVKIPNAEAADIINIELSQLELPLFSENAVKALEKEFVCPNFEMIRRVLKALDRVNEFTFDIRLAIAKIFYFDTYETMVGNKSDHKFSDNSEESPRKFAGVEFKDCVPVKKFMAETFATVPSLKEACIRKITDFWDSIPDKDNVKFLPDELQEAILSSPQPN